MSRRRLTPPGRSPSALGPGSIKCPAEYEMAATVMRSEYVPSKRNEMALACSDHSDVERAVRYAVKGDCAAAKRALARARCRMIAKA